MGSKEIIFLFRSMHSPIRQIISFDTMTRIFYMLNSGMVLTLRSREGVHIRAAKQLHFNAWQQTRNLS